MTTKDSSYPVHTEFQVLTSGRGLQSLTVKQKDTKTALSLQPLHWGISNDYNLLKGLIIAALTDLLIAIFLLFYLSIYILPIMYVFIT